MPRVFRSRFCGGTKACFKKLGHFSNKNLFLNRIKTRQHLLLLIGSPEVGEGGDPDGVALVEGQAKPPEQVQVGNARVKVCAAHLVNNN